MKAVIQAGGKGSRMIPLTRDRIPKPLLEINGVPLLEVQINTLKREGISEFILVIGHLGEQIEETFGDGSRLGVHIDYFRETSPLGSAGALHYVRDLLGPDPFLLVFGDLIFDFDVNRMLRFHEVHHSICTIFAHPNAHPYDSDLLEADGNGRLTALLPKQQERTGWHKNLVSAGIYLVSGEAVNDILPVKTDFSNEIIPQWMQQGRPVFVYRTPEFVKDAGTPDRFQECEEALKKGIPQAGNLQRQQKCIFLDRDGVVNRENGLIWNEEMFELEPCAAEAIRRINVSPYLAILASNQPAPAKGLCKIADIERIHRKMETQLGKVGAYLDDIIYCPHHPDKGFPEEDPALKIDCSCRKPKTGMIDEMAERYNITNKDSWIIGDRTVDIQTGVNAGLHTCLVHTGEAGRDGKYEVKAEVEADDLLEAVEKILGNA